MRDHRPSRRSLLAGSLGGAAALALGPGPAAAADVRHRPRRRLSVLVASNEPWGTYHTRPLLAEAARQGHRLTHLVPDLSRVAAGDPVPVAVPGAEPPADLLVVTGAGDWPVDCAARLLTRPGLPLVASSLAYLKPERAPRAGELRRRLRAVTSSSPAEARAFSAYLGTDRPVRVVGSPQTDDLPPRRPEKDLVLVLTSVTHPDATGAAAPGTELLLASAGELAAAGKRVLVGLHPREDRSLWDRYEISDVPSVTAAARAEAAIGIPGTVFPLVAAVGTPVVGCTDPRLAVPDYLLDVCSSTVTDAGQAVPAVAGARLPAADVLADAVGPVGGSARRLLGVWADAVHGGGPAR